MTAYIPRLSAYSLIVLCVLIVSAIATAWLLLFGGTGILKNILLQTAEQFSSKGNVNDTLYLYALICVVSQLIVVPSGSLILIVAGFLYGPLLAAGIFSVAQLLTAWPVYRVASSFLHSGKQQSLAKFQNLFTSSKLANSLREEGFVASITIRLTPVIPSAVAGVLAAGLNIPLRSFLLATALVCWIRPLFFAAIGSSLGEVSQLRKSLQQPEDISLFPVVIVFFTSLLLLVARVWLRRR